MAPTNPHQLYDIEAIAPRTREAQKFLRLGLRVRGSRVGGGGGYRGYWI